MLIVISNTSSSIVTISSSAVADWFSLLCCNFVDKLSIVPLKVSNVDSVVVQYMLWILHKITCL